jgi:hypothetical protein
MLCLLGTFACVNLASTEVCNRETITNTDPCKIITPGRTSGFLLAFLPLPPSPLSRLTHRQNVATNVQNYNAENIRCKGRAHYTNKANQAVMHGHHKQELEVLAFFEADLLASLPKYALRDMSSYLLVIHSSSLRALALHTSDPYMLQTMNKGATSVAISCSPYANDTSPLLLP